MKSHVYPQNQEIQETPCLGEASKVTGEVGKSRGFRKVSVPSFEQCLLRLPQTTGCGRERNFPGRDCPNGELGSTLRRSGFASPPGARNMFTAVG